MCHITSVFSMHYSTRWWLFIRSKIKRLFIRSKVVHANAVVRVPGEDHDRIPPYGGACRAPRSLRSLSRRPVQRCEKLMNKAKMISYLCELFYSLLNLVVIGGALRILLSVERYTGECFIVCIVYFTRCRVLTVFAFQRNLKVNQILSTL